jgi:subtilisin-like proprotein convertase family protein
VIRPLYRFKKDKLAPYTGRFQAQDKLGNFNRYQSAEGIWKLFIRDDANFDRGKIESWKLEFGYNVTGPDTFSSNIPLLEIFTLNQTINNDSFIVCRIQVNDRLQ